MCNSKMYSKNSSIKEVRLIDLKFSQASLLHTPAFGRVLVSMIMTHKFLLLYVVFLWVRSCLGGREELEVHNGIQQSSILLPILFFLVISHGLDVAFAEQREALQIYL